MLGTGAGERADIVCQMAQQQGWAVTNYEGFVEYCGLHGSGQHHPFTDLGLVSSNIWHGSGGEPSIILGSLLALGQRL